MGFGLLSPGGNLISSLGLTLRRGIYNWRATPFARIFVSMIATASRPTTFLLHGRAMRMGLSSVRFAASVCLQSVQGSTSVEFSEGDGSFPESLSPRAVAEGRFSVKNSKKSLVIS